MKKDPNEFIFVKKKLNPKSSAHVLPPQQIMVHPYDMLFPSVFKRM